MSSAGPLQPRNQTVRNCLNAASVVAYQSLLMKSGQATYMQPYGAPTMLGDLSSYQGEILFEIIAPGYPRSTTGAPFALTCLNGLVVRQKAGTEEVDVIGEMQGMIRILGMCVSSTIWDTANPSHTAHPVAILNGIHTTRNTGRYAILAGDLILARFPPLMRNPQVALDVYSSMSDSRRVLEHTPLRHVTDPLTNKEMRDLTKDKTFRTLLAAVCAISVEYGMLLGDARRGGVGTKEHHDAVATTLRDKITYRPIGTAAEKKPSLVLQNSRLNFQGDLDFATNRIADLLFTQTDAGPSISNNMDAVTIAMVNLSPTILSSIMSQIVGVAQTSAPIDKPYNLSETPTMASLMNRIRL